MTSQKEIDKIFEPYYKALMALVILGAFAFGVDVLVRYYYEAPPEARAAQQNLRGL